MSETAEIILVAAGIVFLIIVVMLMFIVAMVSYGSYKYTKSRRNEMGTDDPMTELKVQVIEEEQLPVPVRLEMYQNLLKSAVSKQDFKFAAILRDKIKSLS